MCVWNDLIGHAPGSIANIIGPEAPECTVTLFEKETHNITRLSWHQIPHHTQCLQILARN